MRKTILIISLIALLLIVLPVHASSSAIQFDQGEAISLQWQLQYNIQQVSLWLKNLQDSIFQANFHVDNEIFIQRINQLLERVAGS